MKIKFPKMKIGDVIIFFGMWVVGIGLFFGLMLLGQTQFHYHISWQDALTISIPVGFIWTIIGTVLSYKDNKIAAGRQAISKAVSNVLSKNN